jgi:hypothetical protein
MIIRKIISLPSVLAACVASYGLPVLSSAGAAAGVALVMCAGAPSAQAIPSHKKGGGGGGKGGGGKGGGHAQPHAQPKGGKSGGASKGGKPHGKSGGAPQHNAHAAPHGKSAPHGGNASGPNHGSHHAVSGGPVHRGPRHGYHGLPGGAVPYSYGGYRYYRVGPRFYYPYFYGGRTVYIDIDAEGGVPLPPPPSGSIEINF